jgi:hypothetical protein
VLPFGKKLILGLLAIITLEEAAPFYTYAPFPALLIFFKCVLEVVLCEGVQHHLRFCPTHLNFVNIAAFHLYLQLENRKIRLVWDSSRVIFGKKFPG